MIDVSSSRRRFILQIDPLARSFYPRFAVISNVFGRLMRAKTVGKLHIKSLTTASGMMPMCNRIFFHLLNGLNLRF